MHHNLSSNIFWGGSIPRPLPQWGPSPYPLGAFGASFLALAMVGYWCLTSLNVAEMISAMIRPPTF